MPRATSTKRHNQHINEHDGDPQIVKDDQFMGSAFDQWLNDMVAQEVVEPEQPVIPDVKVKAHPSANENKELRLQLEEHAQQQAQELSLRMQRAGRQQSLPLENPQLVGDLLFPPLLEKKDEQAEAGNEEDDYEGEVRRVTSEEEVKRAQQLNVLKAKSVSDIRRKSIIPSELLQKIQRLAHAIKARFSPQDKFYLKAFGRIMADAGVQFYHDPFVRVGSLVPQQTPAVSIPQRKRAGVHENA
ncbi:MAG: hypothetical protein IPP74_00185 [Alphaproteobacteria bacterium]|nr:hypothetical protein [Alphaproteobacteria bacterium]